MSTAPQSWQCWLPFPPSANNLYATGRGNRRFTTGPYRKWRIEAHSLIMANGPRRAFDVPVNVNVALTPPPRSRRRDADNRLKPILDSLVRMGVLIDDCQEHVAAITVRWTDRGRPGALVTVTPIETADLDKEKPTELACSAG